MSREEQFQGDLNLGDEGIEFYKSLTEMSAEAFSNEFLAEIIHEMVSDLKRKLELDWAQPHRKDVYAKVTIAIWKALKK